MKLIKILLLATVVSLASPAFAADDEFTPDSFSIEGGTSFSKGSKSNMGRIGVQWDWDKKWFADAPVFITGYWDASVGYWHSSDRGGDHDIGDFGFTPVFRFQKNGATDFIPYAEFAIGFHYLTAKDITEKRRFSTNFQFGDHIGAGFLFGKGGEYDLAYRMQHLSNAGIDHPNPGINFHQIRFEYHF